MNRPYLLLLCLYIFSHQLISQDLRVEPPNWWTEMKHNSIQVLVYGEEISSLTPEIIYEGISLDSIVKVENPNYQFLYLTLQPGIKPGTALIKFKRGKKTVEKYDFDILSREEGSADRIGFNPSDVMYLITPDRFVNGNPENDHIATMQDMEGRDNKFGRHGGDITGIIQHLDYIRDMGFTALWVNPVIENDMPRSSYHGYAITDFYKVDPRFGSNEEYRKLSEKAKSMDIKLIMDMIVNHSGSEHWFVKDPPTKDWINYGGNYVPTNHRRFANQDIYASEYDKKRNADGWFVRSMLDLNQRNPLMADYLIMNTIWWVEYAGLAGIRMDTYPYPDKNFMTDWTCAILEEYPNFNIVGEEWVDKPAVVSYWQRGKNNHDGYTSCLPSVFDFPIQAALKAALVSEEKSHGSGIVFLYEKLSQDFLYPDPGNLVTFPDNHDMDRFFTQVNDDYDLFKMGISYILTMRGIPQIYYGTEILMNNTGSPGDHGIIRTDFPGGWEGDTVNAFTGEGLTEQQKDAQNFMKKLQNWRKQKEVIHNGKLMQFAPEDGIYSYFRYNDSDKVLVIMNKNSTNTLLDPEKYAEIMQGITTGKDVISAQEFPMQNEFTVPGKTTLILELK